MSYTQAQWDAAKTQAEYATVGWPAAPTLNRAADAEGASLFAWGPATPTDISTAYLAAGYWLGVAGRLLGVRELGTQASGALGQAYAYAMIPASLSSGVGDVLHRAAASISQAMQVSTASAQSKAEASSVGGNLLAFAPQAQAAADKASTANQLTSWVDPGSYLPSLPGLSSLFSPEFIARVQAFIATATSAAKIVALTVATTAGLALGYVGYRLVRKVTG